MIQYTNRYGLPGAFYKAVVNDDYDPGESDITVTQLIGPPQIRVLLKQNTVNVDVSEMLFAIMGKAVHKVLEKHEPSAITEERLYMDIHGWKLGGQFDRLSLSKHTLQDYKFASVYELLEGLKPDRERQLNVLAQLAILNGYPVKRLEVVHMPRDFSKRRARTQKNYPNIQIQRVQVPLWDESERMAYIDARVKLHQEAEKACPPCTPEEMWAAPTRYAVMRKGRKSAINGKHTTRQAAQDQVDELERTAKKKGHYIEVRPAERVRCADYCPAAQVCPQWQAFRESQEGGAA